MGISTAEVASLVNKIRREKLACNNFSWQLGNENYSLTCCFAVYYGYLFSSKGIS